MSSRDFDRLQNRPTVVSCSRRGDQKRELTKVRDASAVGQEKSEAFSVNILNTHIKKYRACPDNRGVRFFGSWADVGTVAIAIHNAATADCHVCLKLIDFPPTVVGENMGPSLVALAPVLDLLLSAKHLFVAARTGSERLRARIFSMERWPRRGGRERGSVLARVTFRKRNPHHCRFRFRGTFVH